MTGAARYAEHPKKLSNPLDDVFRLSVSVPSARLHPKICVAGTNVSIHSRPIRRLTEAADGEGSRGLPLPEGKGYGKGFHRLRRLVNSSFPPEGEGLKPQRNF